MDFSQCTEGTWINYFTIGFNYRNIELIDCDYFSQYHNFIIPGDNRFNQVQ